MAILGQSTLCPNQQETQMEVGTAMTFLRSLICSVLLSSTVAFAQIPSNAITSSNLDDSPYWQWNHDPGTPGTSVGSSTYPVANPSLDGASREFDVAYSDYGGELYHLLFGQDTTATTFIYDTYVYITDPTQVQNLELDVNQVLADDETIIFATQCSSISGTWEYTYVSGGAPHWKASNLPCNPLNWAPNKWHHIQIQMHRDSGDVVTHDWVKFDNGNKRYFKNAVGASGLFLNWGIGDLVLNFQVDGASANSGTIQGYLDQMQVTRW